MDNRKDLISEKGRYIGVDGCKNGWIVAVIDSGKLNVENYDSITQIVNGHISSLQKIIRIMILMLGFAFLAQEIGMRLRQSLTVD